MDEAAYQARVDAFLAHATSVDHSSNPVGIAAHLIRAEREAAYEWDVDGVTVASLADVFTKVDEWQDTRDFDLMYLIWLLSLGRGDTPTTRLAPERARGHRGPAGRQPLPLRRPAAGRPGRQPVVLVREPPDHRAHDRAARRCPPARRHVHRHRAHRAPSTPSGPAPTSSPGSGAAGARLLRVALERLHAQEHHAAAHARRAERRPRGRRRRGRGARPVPAGHGRPQPRRLVHGAAGPHLQEGQDVLARRGHVEHGDVRLRRHRRRLPVPGRRRRHLPVRGHPLPAAAAGRRHRDRRPHQRGARAPRRVLRRQPAGHRGRRGPVRA